MTRNLIKVGNSEALTLTKDMKDHLGIVGGKVDLQLVEGAIILKAPKPTLDEVLKYADEQFGEALKNLAK